MYQFPNCVSIPQVRKIGKTGGSNTIFIHKDLICSIGHDLSVNNHDTETLCLKITNQKSKNMFIDTIYRHPSGNKELLLVNSSRKTKTEITYRLQ